MASAFRNLHALDQYRRTYMDQVGDAGCGMFVLPSPVMGELRVVASNELGWDHVSVSLHNRPPVWTEMEHVKRLFWQDDAVVMQLHVAVSAHISIHPHTLHLWRPHDVALPLPPPIMV